MAITAKSILSQVARDLNDETSIRWTTGDLVAYFNDGQRDILTYRPDARNIAADLTLVAGAKQALPAGGEKLIDVLHNNTASSKRAITKVDRKLMDAQSKGWRGAPASLEVWHFMYDEREPRSFDVFPPAAVGAVLAIEYAAVPTDIPTPAEFTTTAAITGNLSLSDLFAEAMRLGIMARCYEKQTEYTANPNLAVAYRTAFAQALGIEAKGTAAVSPNAQA